MRKLLTFIKVSGIWLWFTLMSVLCYLLWCVLPEKYFGRTVILIVAGVVGFLNLILLLSNLSKIARGKPASEITPLEGFSTEPDEYTAGSNKHKYAYPHINPKMLYDRPQGFCFGRDVHTKKYVCRRMDEEGAVLISGGSGTGKSSSFIINYLLWSKGL